MDIRKRLLELQLQRGWSDYKIAKEAGLSPNTVSNIYRRGRTSEIDRKLIALKRRFLKTLVNHRLHSINRRETNYVGTQ